jgi:hypothetical protein
MLLATRFYLANRETIDAKIKEREKAEEEEKKRKLEEKRWVCC